MGDINFEFSKEKRFKLLTLPTALIGMGAAVAFAATSAAATPAIIAASAVGGLVGGALALPVGLLAIVGTATTLFKTGSAFVKSLSPARIKRRRMHHPNSLVAKHALLQIPVVTGKAFVAEAKLWTAGIMIAGFQALKTLVPSMPKWTKKAPASPANKDVKSKPAATTQTPAPAPAPAPAPEAKLKKSFESKPANENQKKAAPQTSKPKKSTLKK